MNKLEIECENIINVIEKKSDEKILKDITKKWERRCPQCKSSIFHTSKCNRDRLEKSGLICKKCNGVNQRLYPNINALQRECKCGKITTYKNRKSYNQAEKENKLCISCSHHLPCKEETKNKISKANSGENNGMFGAVFTEKERTRRREQLKPYWGRKLTKSQILKMSLSLRQKCAEKYNLFGYKGPRINPHACKFIDEYNHKNGYNFQHAMNGGEFYVIDAGAWVDGYDKDKNVVFEYDEKHHFDFNGNLKEKDIRRMYFIKETLKCKIIRYNEKTSELKEY